MRLYNVDCTMRSAGPQKWLPHLTGLRNLGPGADRRQSMQGGALEGCCVTYRAWKYRCKPVDCRLCHELSGYLWQMAIRKCSLAYGQSDSLLTQPNSLESLHTAPILILCHSSAIAEAMKGELVSSWN